MDKIEAIISRFRPVISEHKQQHTDICENCAGTMQSRDGFLQCLVCGVQKGRTSDSFNAGFDCSTTIGIRVFNCSGVFMLIS